MRPLGGGFKWLIAGLAAMLCACVTVPRGETQQAAIADTSLGLAGAAVAPAPDSWWQGFGDAQQDHQIEPAQRDNPGLAQATARLRLAEAQVQAARSAQLPDAKLTGGETRLKIPGGFPAAIAGGQTVWLGDLGAVLSWDLDLWGEHADAAAQTRALAAAARLDIDDARLLLTG